VLDLHPDRVRRAVAVVRLDPDVGARSGRTHLAPRRVAAQPLVERGEHDLRGRLGGIEVGGDHLHASVRRHLGREGVERAPLDEHLSREAHERIEERVHLVGCRHGSVV